MWQWVELFSAAFLCINNILFNHMSSSLCCQAQQNLLEGFRTDVTGLDQSWSSQSSALVDWLRLCWGISKNPLLSKSAATVSESEWWLKSFKVKQSVAPLCCYMNVMWCVWSSHTLALCHNEDNMGCINLGWTKYDRVTAVIDWWLSWTC